jgi:hypothetical protein
LCTINTPVINNCVTNNDLCHTNFGTDTNLITNTSRNFNADIKMSTDLPQSPALSISKNKSKDLPVELSINNFALENLQCQKLQKYIFPRHDRGPTKAGLRTISPLKSLEYVGNLCQHKLQPNLKQFWDSVAGRDCSFPEISKIRIQSTRH